MLDRVYVDLVRPLLFEDLSASAAPELIMVGGQPGAGKTAATVQAVRDLMRHGGGVAYINGDELRPFHPQCAALVAADRSTAANKTGADVGLWVERAIREAAAGRFHAVIETTMRQPEVVRRTAEQFTAQGFGFEMRVVVVDPEASQLGIYEQFASQAGQGRPLRRSPGARALLVAGLEGVAGQSAARPSAAAAAGWRAPAHRSSMVFVGTAARAGRGANHGSTGRAVRADALRGVA